MQGQSEHGSYDACDVGQFPELCIVSSAPAFDLDASILYSAPSSGHKSNW